MQTRQSIPQLRRRHTDLKTSNVFRGSELDKPLVLLLLVCLSPVVLVNALLSFMHGDSLCYKQPVKDALGRTIQLLRCRYGAFKNIAVLFSVLEGEVALCGVPLTRDIPLSTNTIRLMAGLPAGLFNAVQLHNASGLAVADPNALMRAQINGSRAEYIGLMLKSVICRTFYCTNHNALSSPAAFTMFGMTINNDTMSKAVDWATSEGASRNQCEIGFFINVNSVNICAHQPELLSHLNAANKCFADGSGMRLAAKSMGVRIVDNVNGTDMLPHLCKKAAFDQKRIFLLGAKPGVAASASRSLQQQYPGLVISGVHDGYFNEHETQSVIDKINGSETDILLVAMGSPSQEAWLIQHRKQLRCSRALAVGGLFDFFSGNIPRAPMWMRETGMEWVWRLIQEPKTKFNRYVLGNPMFLFRTFVLKSTIKGV